MKKIKFGDATPIQIRSAVGEVCRVCQMRKVCMHGNGEGSTDLFLLCLGLSNIDDDIFDFEIKVEIDENESSLTNPLRINKRESSPNKMIEKLKEIWNCSYGNFYYENGKLELSTGGWSENEDIINELGLSLFWLMYWQESCRGGHYRFEIPVQEKGPLSHEKVEKAVRNSI